MSFENLRLKKQLQKAIEEEGYINPTPIQSQAIPHLLENRDLIGIAQTGTGKTAAFILPILQQLSNTHKKIIPGAPRVLVLAPTRELATQIGYSFSIYGKYLKFKHAVIFGGVNQNTQVRAISKGINILIATPGRLLDLIDQGYVKLLHVEYFVLDEADRMLDMGFIHDVNKIISLLPKKRQSLFFSATMSQEVSKLARMLLSNPMLVEVTPQATIVEVIEQFVFFVDTENKDDLLLGLLYHKNLKSVLIFTRTKYRADKVSCMLNKNNINSDALHGDKSQTQRNKVMHDFRSGKLRVLVATDIAARGIDVDDISHVINYDIPNEPENYVHRIGRTARAGAQGAAYSFCAADERDYLNKIESLIKVQLNIAEHVYHSNKSQYATGDEAKPPKRKGRPNKKFNSRFNKQTSSTNRPYKQSTKSNKK